MRIGELAAETGVNLQTIRFYERRGLLSEPPRLTSGYRIYSTEAVRRIRFIKRFQGLGFKLAEIAQLLKEREQRSSNPARVRAMAEAKVHDLEERIRGLQSMRDELSCLLARCTCGTGLSICPVFDESDHPETLDMEAGQTRTRAGVPIHE